MIAVTCNLVCFPLTQGPSWRTLLVFPYTFAWDGPICGVITAADRRKVGLRW